MQEPSQSARDALRAYHAAAGLAPPVRDQVWRGIEAGLDDPAAPIPAFGAEQPEQPAQPRRGRIVAWALGASLAAAAALLAVCNQRGSFTGPTQPGGEAAQYGATPRDDGETRARAPAPSTIVEAPDPAPTDAQIPTQPARRRPPATTATTVAAVDPIIPIITPAGSDLAAEVALLRQARTALDGDDPDTAMRVVDEHAGLFPAGQMREDRQRLRIEALCGLGQSEAARAAADTFLLAYPDSTHAARVRTMCRDPQ